MRRHTHTYSVAVTPPSSKPTHYDVTLEFDDFDGLTWISVDSLIRAYEESDHGYLARAMKSHVRKYRRLRYG